MGTPKKEVGLEYMIELGIKPVKTSNVLATVIEKNAKKETSEKIYEFMTRRAEEYDNSSNHKDFYALKHESLKLSLSMDGAICGDYFRKVCNWIAEHKEFFNGSILEVGCGCGIFSCFLGRLFPDQQIVSIDICPEAIKLAKQLAERLKVTNIDFVESDVSAITQKFDTVFSSKVLHEIMPRIDGLHYEDLLQITAKRYENACAAYASQISKIINDTGFLVSIERVGISPMLWGWLAALKNTGFCKYHYASQMLQSTEIDAECDFAIICLEKNDDESMNDLPERIVDIAYKGEIDCDQDFFDWKATVLLGLLKGNLIDGYSAYNAEGIRCAKIALWENKYDTNSFILEQFCNNPEQDHQYQVIVMPQRDLDQCKKLMIDRQSQWVIGKLIVEQIVD